MGAPRSSYVIGIEQISKALIASGYLTLDAQAKALGVHRNTAWTIVNTKHKLGRLSAKTTQRILANPETPAGCAHRYREISDREVKTSLVQRKTELKNKLCILRVQKIIPRSIYVSSELI